MSKIDTTQWKEYSISDLFITEVVGRKIQVPTGSYIERKYLKEGETPRITVTGINNGICGYFEDLTNNLNYRVFENFISVSFLGTVFYHPYKASLDMKVHALKLKDKQLNEYVGGYIVSIIKKSIQNNNYSDQLSSTVLPQLKIKLPVDLNGNPNFAYMEEYMQNLESAVSSSLTALRSAKSSKTCEKVDIASWKDFHLYDIFNIDSGTKLDKAKMDTTGDEICFVGRSGVNNGITQKVKRIEGLAPYNAGNLTLSLGGAYLGSCFVQEEPFYTSQNVVVLIPKENIGFYAKQFIATAIFKESQNNYKAFIKELNAFVKTTFSIKLPINGSGEIDYDFMESYMQKKYSKAEQYYKNLKAM